MLKREIIFIVGVFIVALGLYVVWYTIERHAKIANNAECDQRLSQPLAPGVPQQLCTIEVVPPTLWNLVRGRFVFEHLPARFSVPIPSVADILLGNYSLQPATAGCDQSATTTDCSTLPPPSQSEPQPYVPPNTVQPSETWTSATGTPISLYGFSFKLPSGWHGSVFREAYAGDLHALVQSNSTDKGFIIDCPPAGKGLEAATRLSTEERMFTAEGMEYSVAFEKWTAPDNDPWYFVWVRMPPSEGSSTGSSGTYCLVQGSETPDIEGAMRMLYETWE